MSTSVKKICLWPIFLIILKENCRLNSSVIVDRGRLLVHLQNTLKLRPYIFSITIHRSKMNLCLGKSSSLEKEGKTAIFSNNGAILPKKLIASSHGKCNPICNFSAKELQTATKNYDKRQVIKDEVEYKLYKGLLQDRPISVKKFELNKFTREEQARQCSFNNIVFASQMCHRNFLKLIGCCLETQIPILAFEFVGNPTLEYCIFSHPEAHFRPLPWKHRLKIAMETAHAISYLHAGFPRPIVFRDLRPSNILLQEEYVVAVFDFSLSESIPEGKTHIEEKFDAKGAAVCIAPEQVSEMASNEKFDVFCFGSFLIELLIGQKLNEFERPKANSYERQSSCLLFHVVKCIRNGMFNHVIDPVIVGDGLCPEKEQQLVNLTELAFKCHSASAEDRPTMVDVVKQLRQMYRSSM